MFLRDHTTKRKDTHFFQIENLWVSYSPSPVRPTPLHPTATLLGLSRTTELTATAAMPVFWLRGMTTEDITVTQDLGAHGIAAITGFWRQ